MPEYSGGRLPGDSGWPHAAAAPAEPKTDVAGPGETPDSLPRVR